MDFKQWETENNTHLLQAGVVFLSIVSFFTTANGMGEYIFVNNKFIAYAASAAIQGILLALSMNLPEYLHGIWTRKNTEKKKLKWYQTLIKTAGRIFLWVCVILLTGVTIFCSSWFSYVYIADIIHRGSWGIDSGLLVQQTYRTELYDARDYVHTYRIYLEETMGEKILLLEEQADRLSDSGTSITIAWEDERSTYAPNNGSTASNYMATVINAMERALEENSSKESRDLAVTAVADAKENIMNRMEEIQNNLEVLNSNITNYNNQVATLTNRIRNATENTNTEALTNSINSYTQLISNMSQRQAALQTEYMQLDMALMRLPFYESQLGLSNSTSSISIRNELMQLQSEFFSQEPNEENMMNVATEIFENLRDAARTASGDADVENSGSLQEELSYTQLLIQMNRLIQTLKDYSEIKDIETNLEDMIAELRTVDMSTGSVSVNTKATAETDIANAETAEKTAAEDEDQWKPEWLDRLAALKAQVSAMPAYSGTEEGEIGTDSVLTESQIDILRNYDRNEASRELDDMIRRYLSNHSAIYDGIIYLQSPYRGLAVFALVLALSFDLSGFIFGFVALGQKDMDRGPQKEDVDSKDMDRGTQKEDVDSKEKWSIVETLNQYVVLTGDCENRNGNYRYTSFKNGVLYDWNVKDTVPYIQGIYKMEKEKTEDLYSKGSLVSRDGQELLFSNQSEKARDGIYLDCQLDFDEGGLMLVREDQKKFLTSVDEYVPVHSYSPKRGENRTIPVKQLAQDKIDVKIAVVALNARGTRVAAIYMIEGEK